MSGVMGDMQLALALRLEGVTGAGSEELERLVGVADLVASLPDPEIDPVFAAKLEQRLLTEGLVEAKTETPEPYQGLRVVRTPQPEIAPAREEKLAPNVITLPRRRYVMRKALVAAIAAALAMAMPVAMASTALPGSPGYSLNKARFAIQLHFASANDKPFKMAHRGHELISYSARLVAIGAPAWLVNETLAEAKRWLAVATASVIRAGKTGDIAKLRGMIERDGDLLRKMLPVADESHGDVAGAIDQVESLSDALARAMGVVLAEPTDVGPAVESIAAGISAPSSERESANGSSAGKGKSTDSSKPAAPTTPKIEDPGKKKPATPGGCSTIGSAMLGDALEAPSEMLCRGSQDNQSN